MSHCACGCGGTLHGPAAARVRVTVRPVVPPAPVEPVTLAEGKLHVRVEPAQTIEDALIQGYLTAARQRVELDTEQSWAQQTLEARYHAIPNLQAPLPLRAGPVQAVTAVERVAAADGAVTALTGWRVGLAELAVWPGPEGWPPAPDAVAITYDAGPVACPEPIRQAILLLLGQYYEHRSSAHVGSSAMALPYSVEWLLAPFRVGTGFVPA